MFSLSAPTSCRVGYYLQILTYAARERRACSQSQQDPYVLAPPTYHVEDGHDQDEGSSCHGEGDSGPGLVGDDSGRAQEPVPGGRGAFTAVLREDLKRTLLHYTALYSYK